MILSMVLKGLYHGKARFFCAVAGVAIACGAIVFMTSLASTNAAQAERRAAAMLSALPLDDSPFARMALDYRPNGHVMQGPPMMVGALVSPLTWGNQVIITKSLFTQRRLPVPPIGSALKIVGRHGVYEVEIVEVIDWDTPVRGMPNMFVSADFADYANAESWEDFVVPSCKDLAPSLKGDEQRRMDYATPLMIIAAFLTAVSLLVNSLLLSIESNRSTMMILRTIGLTRLGVVAFVAVESLIAVFIGWIIGVGGAMISLVTYVANDASTFPSGVAFDFGKMLMTLGVLPIVALFAIVFALSSALKVRAMDASSWVPRRRHHGMMVTFALGFAAFVAVEVWGASLMRGFVPSPEWPDAIVSILPSGVSSFDVDKLRDIDGVKRISELVPRQLYMPTNNALFLAAEWLPKFSFIEGDHASACEKVFSTDSVVITRMMSKALNLHVGDELKCFQQGRGGVTNELTFPIIGVVDLNWHMVTSRGLVRGLNRMPPMTMGPVFCSLDTMGLVDPRTYMVEPTMSAPMTHLWVEYEPEFLAKHGVFEAGRLIEAEIAKRLDTPYDSTVRLHARDEIADSTLAHGTDIIGQVARIPFVFLAILSIGFVAMLVAEADARRREFMTLRAVGATRMQLAALLTSVAIKTAFIGIIAGLPLGSLAGWLVSFSTASVWPGMPHWFVIPCPIVFEGAIGAIVFALIFVIPTSIALIKRKI